ncbi:hypothetical protein K438DRAFT_1760877 [Mycena galopus ATCC 62051]|nr:hypothetical protein K438DRAFT_1760877 [Mycena galopus ATCC 62051]
MERQWREDPIETTAVAEAKLVREARIRCNFPLTPISTDYDAWSSHEASVTAAEVIAPASSRKRTHRGTSHRTLLSGCLRRALMSRAPRRRSWLHAVRVHGCAGEVPQCGAGATLDFQFIFNVSQSADSYPYIKRVKIRRFVYVNRFGALDGFVDSRRTLMDQLLLLVQESAFPLTESRSIKLTKILNSSLYFAAIFHVLATTRCREKSHQLDAVPKEWLSSNLPSAETLSFVDFPRESNTLSALDLEITEFSVATISRPHPKKKTGIVVGPLYGLPISLKDKICTKNIENTMGREHSLLLSKVMQATHKDHDHLVLAVLQAAKADSSVSPSGWVVMSEGCQETIVGVLGSLSNSLDGVKTSYKAVLSKQPEKKDPLTTRKRRNGEEYNLIDHGNGEKLCFAIMGDNGAVAPHPPVRRGLEMCRDARLAAGHQRRNCINRPVSISKGAIWSAAAMKDFQTATAPSGERLIASWLSQVSLFIMPVLASRSDRNCFRDGQYTMNLNVLDHSSLVIPVSQVDQTFDVQRPREELYSKEDRENYEICAQPF